MFFLLSIVLLLHILFFYLLEIIYIVIYNKSIAFLNPVIICWQFHGCINLGHFQFPQYMLPFPPSPMKPSSSQQGPSYSDVFCLTFDLQGFVTVVLMSMNRGLAIGKWLTSQWLQHWRKWYCLPSVPTTSTVHRPSGRGAHQHLSYAWWDADSPDLVQVCGANHSWGEFMTVVLVSWPEDIALQLLSSSWLWHSFYSSSMLFPVPQMV